MSTGQHPDHDRRRRARHRRRSTVAVVALAALVAVAAGCGSGSSQPGVAQTGTETTTPTAPSSAGNGGALSGSQRTRVLQFVSCMRKNGVPNLPEPNGKGGLLFGEGGAINPSSPAFQRAANACRRFAPGGTATAAAQAPARAARFGKCMRSHGLPNFPDPKTIGGNFTVQIPANVDPNSPQFQTAIHACQSVSPFPGGGG